jgi:hypothetical protein
MAEYEALINSLRITIELGIRWLDIRDDSQLVIDQVMKESSCHNPKMVVYYQEVHKLEEKFNGLELNHILRRLNEAADELAKMASGRGPVLAGAFTSDQHNPLVCYEEPEQAGNELPTLGSGADAPSAPSDPKVMEIDEGPVADSDPLLDWGILFLDCLIREVLPADKTEAQWLTHCAKSDVIIKGELYRQSHTRILQRCIPIK